MESSAQTADPKLPSVSGTSILDSSMGRKLQPSVQSKLFPSDSGRNLLEVREEEACCLPWAAFPEPPCPASTSVFALPWEHQGLESREHCANKSRLFVSFTMTETAELDSPYRSYSNPTSQDTRAYWKG